MFTAGMLVRLAPVGALSGTHFFLTTSGSALDHGFRKGTGLFAVRGRWESANIAILRGSSWPGFYSALDTGSFGEETPEAKRPTLCPLLPP